MSTPAQTVRLRFQNPRYERIVRLNTESIARKMGFNDDQVFDISLAVEEAYTNAIEHSREVPDEGGGPVPIVVELVYHLYPNRLEVTVQDTGVGFVDVNRSAAELADLERDDADRGRGLALMRQLSDRVDILSEPGVGTLVRICKFLTGEQAGS